MPEQFDAAGSEEPGPRYFEPNFAFDGKGGYAIAHNAQMNAFRAGWVNLRNVSELATFAE